MRQANNQTTLLLICALGFALITASASMSNWGNAYFLQNPEAAQGAPSFTTLYMVSMIVCSVIAGLGCLFASAKTTKAILAWGAPLMVAGALCSFLTRFFPTIAQATAVLSPILLGVGIMACLLSWAIIFAAQNPEVGFLGYLVGYLLSGILRFLLEGVPSSAIGAVMTFCIMPGAWIIIRYATHRVDLGQGIFTDNPIEQRTVLAHVLKLSWRSILYAAAIAFVCGIIRSLTSYGMSGSYINYASMAGAFLSGLALIICWQVSAFRLSFFHIFRVVFPVAAACIFLLPFVGSARLGFVAALIYMVYSFISACMELYAFQASRDYGISPVVIYVLFILGVQLFTTSGFAIGNGILEAGSGGAEGLMHLSLVGLLVLAAFVYATHGIAERYDNMNEIALEFLKIRGGARADTGPAAPSDVNVEELEDSDFTGQDDKHDGAVLPSIAKVAEEKEAKRYLDRISKQCEQLAKDYGLSGREREVVELLARGNSIAGIAKELYISENTTKTHLKRIYNKLGIHKRQELLDLVKQQAPKT